MLLSKHRQKNNKAFSLIELLTVTAIFCIIAVSVPVVFRTTSLLWKKVDEKVTVTSDMRTCFMRIKTDVKSLKVAQKGNIYCKGTQDPTTFRCVSFLLDEGKSGMCEIGYYLDEVGNTLRRYKLIEPEEIFQQTLGDLNDEVLCRNVIEFDAAYYDGETWHNEWDAGLNGDESGEKPEAVKFVISVFKENRPDDKEDYELQVSF